MRLIRFIISLIRANLEPTPKKVDTSSPIFDDVDQWLYDTEHFFD